MKSTGEILSMAQKRTLRHSKNRGEVRSCAWADKRLSCGLTRSGKFMMPPPNRKTFSLLGLALALVSCAVPKATVVAQPRATIAVVKEPEPIVVEASLPAMPDDGIRMPDMLGLPSDGDFRSTHPSGLKPVTGSGAVISRPPTDPPARVKPQAAVSE
jgi:hypothetical protein